MELALAHLAHGRRQRLLAYLLARLARVHQVPAVGAVDRAGLGLGPGRAHRGVGPQGVFILGLLLLLGRPAALAVAHVGAVELGAEAVELGVVGGAHHHGAVVVVDGGVHALAPPGHHAPAGRVVAGLRAAVDGVDEDALLARQPHRGAGPPLAVLVGRLVARDEDLPQGAAAAVPFQLLDRPVDHSAHVLGAAVGAQGEELFVDGVQVGGQVALYDDVAVLFGAGAAVGQQANAQDRPRLGPGRLVDDVPQLLAGRVDQPVHAAAGVQGDDHVDAGDLLFLLLFLSLSRSLVVAPASALGFGGAGQDQHARQRHRCEGGSHGYLHYLVWMKFFSLRSRRNQRTNRKMVLPRVKKISASASFSNK